MSACLPYSCCVACKYGSISRSKGVFSGFWGFRVGLCCLGGLRGLCGFCTRVELGGLKACGVFASVFPLLCPAFILVALLFLLLSFRFPLLSCFRLALLLGFFPLLVLFLCGLLFPFPLRTICAKKKGRKGFAPCVLASCYVCLDACVVIEEFRCRCFRSFQLARLVLPTDAAWVGWLARSYFDFLGHNVNIAYNRPAFLK